MTAPALVEVAAADPMAAVRALHRMTKAGFVLALENGRLMIEPISRLSDLQRAYIRANKPALVALLIDAETLADALALAGPAGLAWREDTPADWSDARLLAAGEVLYANGRMVNRMDRRYARENAPPSPPFREYRRPESTPDIPRIADNVVSIEREATS